MTGFRELPEGLLLLSCSAGSADDVEGFDVSVFIIIIIGAAEVLSSSFGGVFTKVENVNLAFDFSPPLRSDPKRRAFASSPSRLNNDG